MENSVRPLRDGIYVKKLPVKTTPESVRRELLGIIIPQMAQPESTRWEVLAVGPGKRGKKGQIIPCDVKVGDVVVLGPYIDYQDGQHAIFMEGDIRYVEPTPHSL